MLSQDSGQLQTIGCNLQQTFSLVCLNSVVISQTGEEVNSYNSYRRCPVNHCNLSEITTALEELWGFILFLLVTFDFSSLPSQVPVHSPQNCAVCMQFVRKENLLSLACQHQFCRSCWEQHCTVLVKDGAGVGGFGTKGCNWGLWGEL